MEKVDEGVGYIWKMELARPCEMKKKKREGDDRAMAARNERERGKKIKRGP